MSEEVRVWLHLEEGLTDGDKAGDVQHPRWIEVLQLQTLLIKESTQEPVHGVSLPAVTEGEKGNHLTRPRLQKFLPPGSPLVRHLLRWKKLLHGEGLQHRLPHGG